MLFDSQIITRGSGSIAGIVASRNRGGNYFRARVTPVNPNTTYQQSVRSIMAQLAGIWAGTLTKAQRDAWDSYALNVPLPNALGAYRNVGGIAMYQRCNIPRLQADDAALTRVDDAPTIYSLGDYTAPTFAIALASADSVSFGFEATDDWADEAGSAMLVSVSRPKNPGVNYHKGPYRFATAILGDDVTPPTSPEGADSPFPFETGQKLFAFVRVTRVDGRLSTAWRGEKIAT